jgi:hypothetical protein
MVASGTSRWVTAAAITVLLAVGAAGCGGDGDDAAGGSDDQNSTTTEAPVDTTRPSGEWVRVTWQLTRSDYPDLVKGDSGEARVKLTPTCEAGPCDIEVAPNGADGSYRPEGVPRREGVEVNRDPGTLVWDEASATYTQTSTRRSSCTNVDGEIIEDAYDTTTVFTLVYTEPTDDAPARMSGTTTEKVESTDAGLAGDCTPYESSYGVAMAPEGAFDEQAPSILGEYTPTETVVKVEPSGEREPGTRGLLRVQTIAGTDDEPLITGALEQATPLTRAGATWSGTSETKGTECILGTPVADGFEGVESWTNLQVIAVDDEDRPILSSDWTFEENPTDAGVDAGCSFGSNTGRLVMIPTEALS